MPCLGYWCSLLVWEFECVIECMSIPQSYSGPHAAADTRLSVARALESPLQALRSARAPDGRRTHLSDWGMAMGREQRRNTARPVRSHTGNRGNDAADRLANMGAEIGEGHRVVERGSSEPPRGRDEHKDNG